MVAKLGKTHPGHEAVRPFSKHGCSKDLEKDSNVKKRRVEYVLSRMQQLLLFLVIFLFCPVVIFCAFKFLVMEPLYGISDSNVAIGAAVATVIVMHVLITGYILRLIFLQEFSRMGKLEVWTEWDIPGPPQSQVHGPVFIVLLLMSYCSLIIGFPIATFFALKFVVLKSFAHIDADIISAICTVVAVHAAVGFYIYRAIYTKGVLAKSSRDGG
ncbi:uncharacterized protein LOC128266776 [Drosophila gunungcola]|uniref:Uncharacterized protein n=1 Tax=Drosophila gunungcola TaxID=103775 RepID=A0A9P9YYY2_9MUSC|nr:uncharacterized protein LOC128266776 [Drosophila gunungcola]KAI8045708.1 hypothetical protein M5D96_001892 [Drosophila gunungcola]